MPPGPEAQPDRWSGHTHQADREAGRLFVMSRGHTSTCSVRSTSQAYAVFQR